MHLMLYCHIPSLLAIYAAVKSHARYAEMYDCEFETISFHASQPFLIGGKKKPGWKTVKAIDANAHINPSKA